MIHARVWNQLHFVLVNDVRVWGGGGETVSPLAVCLP